MARDPRVSARRTVRSLPAALFLLAYTCSGFAGLVYEVTWTRLLTLHLGHTTAAASTVVGAFLSGLAVGAALVGRRIGAVTPARALVVYAGLEVVVALVALTLPLTLGLAQPALQWAYADGAAGAPFALARVVVAALLVLVPATALGATYPCALRWFADGSPHRTRRSAMLYATNTLGAAAGALTAGFVLIPTVGVRATTWWAVAAGVTSAALAVLAGRGVTDRAPSDETDPPPARRRRAEQATTPAVTPPAQPAGVSLAATVLGVSGTAALLHEIAWTRILALTIGPTTYAFAAALAAVIAGTAAGSWLGTWLIGRVRQPALWLALALAAAAATATITYALAGREVPMYVARQLALGAATTSWLAVSGAITAALVVPTAVCLGLAFPLALAVAGVHGGAAPARVGFVYAVNTAGAVAGSLLAGFVVIPSLGLQGTLQIACTGLLLAAGLVIWRGGLGPTAQSLAGTGAALALALLVTTPPWDQALMASGGYLYAPFAPKDVDLHAMLTAGTLRYYRDGAAATVSVKTLTGTTTLTVDGKTDASTRGDMLTQALVAHLPLLAHDAPRRVAVIGLGSGVTVGAALTHPVEQVDVVEISPEVVEASHFFDAENRQALADPRVRLIVGDGRTHLRLTRATYDAIVSEPSNPWIAGVAALFTAEYFAEARARLAPGGVFCQWANAYNISDADLRAIAATFRTVFPNAMAFLVGEHDVLFVGAAPPPGPSTDVILELPLERLTRLAERPAVVADLGRYGAASPFALLSLVVAGPGELAGYARDARPLDDDRMPLEFSAPREIHQRTGASNGATLRALGVGGASLGPVRDALSTATASDWRDRARMFFRADAFTRAFDDFATALAGDPDDEAALDGLVRSAQLLKRAADAIAVLQGLPRQDAASAARLVAASRLHAAAGEPDRARARADEAIARHPRTPLGLEQLASLHADAERLDALDEAIARLATTFPDRPSVGFNRAVRAFLRGDAATAFAEVEAVLRRAPDYAEAYDLGGAALTRLGRLDQARGLFERSLSFDAHDSTAYTNLGVLALAAGRRAEAASRFAEAIWLDPSSAPARAGLADALAPE